MFKNEVIVSKSDKRKALYHINEVNRILEKYPYSSCFANTITDISRAKNFSKEAAEYIASLHTPITEKLSTDCSIELIKLCTMKCERCVCKKCDKRFDCDGGSPLTGCE